MTPRITSRRIVFKGHWQVETVCYDETRRDGSVQSIVREVVSRPDAATVLLYDPARDSVILTRQFRLPALVNGGRTGLIETCAGLIEEDPATCAAREAEEETGYRAKKLVRLFELYSSPGGLSERLTFFVADYDPADRVGGGGGLAHEGENIEVLELPFDEAYAMIARGEIVDMKTVVLLQWLKIGKLEGR